MRTARGFQVACFALGLALLGAACSTPQRDASGDGVRGGTLQVLSADPDVTLDTTVFYYAPIARAYARTLYGYNLAGPPEQATVPVPDIASGPPQVSADRRTYTFTLRAGVRYAPPVNREVTAHDFITAVQRLYDKQSPSYAQQYADLIAGARRFGAEGVGLCRTEHMFLGERRQYVERLILAEDDDQRAQVLDALLPLQRWDFLQILTAMDGLPTTIRLLDPPLHEFLPNITELSVRVALAEARGEKNEKDLRLMRAVHRLHEAWIPWDMAYCSGARRHMIIGAKR